MEEKVARSVGEFHEGGFPIQLDLDGTERARKVCRYHVTRRGSDSFKASRLQPINPSTPHFLPKFAIISIT